MMLFLDTSVLLASAGSETGASRYVVMQGEKQSWQLMSSGYCVQEALRNLPKLGQEAQIARQIEIEPRLTLVPDVLSLDQVLVFPKAKDRPVIISTLAAKATVLLTLDRADFQRVLGAQVYSMDVRTPSAFLIEQRERGNL